MDLKVNDTSNILQVLLARHRKHGGYYAVKVLQKQMIVKRREVNYLKLFTYPSPGASVCPLMSLSIVYYLQQRHVMVERNVLLKGLQHPFLVGLHFSFQTPNMLFFVLDYVNGGEVCVLKLNSMLAVRQGECLKKKKNTQFCISTSCYKSF